MTGNPRMEEKASSRRPPQVNPAPGQDFWIQRCDVLLDNDKITGVGDGSKERQENPEHKQKIRNTGFVFITYRACYSTRYPDIGLSREGEADRPLLRILNGRDPEPYSVSSRTPVKPTARFPGNQVCGDLC